ncbi:MAG: polyprenyl synthetase family protein [Planctomycetota bacterium]|jgi:geranylgeranyl diphosphate synthase type II
MSTDFTEAKTYLANAASLVEAELRRLMTSRPGIPEKLRAAVEHSLFAGGKRLRPALCLGAAELVGGERKDVLPGACALEMIHTYSLIHDDLPSMDNDDLRRGKPTCHITYGEATAILAGDALLTDAFGVLTASGADSARVRKAVEVLAAAAGAEGMVGGQQLDLDGEGTEPTVERANAIHEKKTAALIRAAVMVGAALAGAGSYESEALSEYGHSLGLAFQVADDILDHTSTAEEMGKSPGKDADQGKLTYVAAVGLEEARKHARALSSEAVAALAPFKGRPGHKVLHELAVLAVERRK